MAGIEPERGLNYLKSKLSPLVEGPDGIAADCSRLICDYVDKNPDTVDRTVALIGRAGALIPSSGRPPCFVTSTAARRTSRWCCFIRANAEAPTGLSFMGMLNPDNDYRPRIYP